MSGDTDQGTTTRMLFLGEHSLAEGLRLIGFETHPDATPSDLERVCRTLIRERASAFVLVDDRLMQSGTPALRQVLDEGGRIVVMALPPLAGPVRLTSRVAERLQALFGPATLDPQERQ
ncbi:V-type ATP synthase subunit F [Thiococcus pfennigii]|uniref:V-type ATP synthase subunit F n=1 Tax=Thiococcus pfennigii TaxID=1057 RepID=UPI001905B0BD|nr:V-type ATP synthase subunit F [Thiococcus pfennigii]MBK1730523.1 ATPase [Thiococcus pfennigii]